MTRVPDSLDAAERLQSETEKPGALRDVSKAPVSILVGLIIQVEATECGQKLPLGTDVSGFIILTKLCYGLIRESP